ncbi:MAG TPA: hypothetical protein VK638_35650 [Edaphobacter sp.]|nr:hypothetical protein [Edaphobacter sp.]
MRAIHMVVALFALSGVALCQQPQSSYPSSCPAGFTVRVDGRAIAHSASDLGKSGNGALLDVRFITTRASRLIAAAITVHGSLPTSRYQPVHGQDGSDGETSQRLTLNAGKDEALTSSTVATKFPMVNWVELNELRYEDGSVWQSTARNQCKITPSKLLLIDAVAQ